MSGKCDHDEPASKRKPPTAVPLTLIALGATAVIVPILLLRRVRGTTSNAAKNAPPPPIRRVSSHKNNIIGAGNSALPHRHFESLRAVDLRQRQDVGEYTGPSQSRFSGGLYALQALGIATCIVGASAVTGVLAIRWAMGVQSAEEFAARMRTEIQSLTPTLSSRIYRHHSGPSMEAAATERLSKAYEEGGLVQWMAVVEKELQMEADDDLNRQRDSEEGPTRT